MATGTRRSWLTPPAGRAWVRHAGAATLFVALAIVATWPLLPRLNVAIASDPYDPLLNATVLWWSAVTPPFSAVWWNAPWFHPAPGVSAFTENLAGISVIASPIYWLTRNPITAYNLALAVTWPASALAGYLLVYRLTRQFEAACLAGLAFAYSPYRASELAHIQVLSAYWLPVALLGLHGYLESRRWPWLLLFGVAWLLQSFANGYFLLFGAVLVALWVVWFVSPRRHWRALGPITVAAVVASLPLVPVLLTYQRIHARFGLRREAYEAVAFSASPASWAEASGRLLAWGGVLRDGGDNLFPGATVVSLVLAGFAAIAWWPSRDRRAGGGSRVRRLTGAVLGLTLTLSLVATVAILIVGPWEIAPLGVAIRMRDLNRALVLLLASAAALAWRSGRARAALAARDPLVFYAVTTVIMALLCCGPVLSVGEMPILSPAPYQWLMALPGFTEVRVPMRFWMLGVLCLSVTAGLVFSRLRFRAAPVRRGTALVLALGLLADGWLAEMPMAAVPETYTLSGAVVPVLELPLGPEHDSAATYRTTGHRRPVVNGVSGYDPPHYAPLQAGLQSRDPQVLGALAALGPFDIVVDGVSDPDGAWTAFAASAPGATETSRNPARTTFHVPAARTGEPALGAAWPVAGVDAFRHDASVAWDGRVQSEWGDHPQRPGQWLVIDLGETRRVAGITHALGPYARDFPRRLQVQVSVDGQTWTTVWAGSTAGAALLAAVRAPRAADMRLAFAPHDARFIRLQQLATHQNMWRVAELQVHAPTAP